MVDLVESDGIAHVSRQAVFHHFLAVDALVGVDVPERHEASLCSRSVCGLTG